MHIHLYLDRSHSKLRTPSDVAGLGSADCRAWTAKALERKRKELAAFLPAYEGIVVRCSAPITAEGEPSRAG